MTKENQERLDKAVVTLKQLLGDSTTLWLFEYLDSYSCQAEEVWCTTEDRMLVEVGYLLDEIVYVSYGVHLLSQVNHGESLRKHIDTISNHLGVQLTILEPLNHWDYANARGER